MVDDDALLRGMLVEELADMGYAPVEAPDGESALREVRARPGLAAVLSDVRMPGMSGTALADAVARERPGLPVVLMSGYPGRWEARRIIAKPFRIAEVEEALREAMGLDGGAA